jgi:hypothetical protein
LIIGKTAITEIENGENKHFIFEIWGFLVNPIYRIGDGTGAFEKMDAIAYYPVAKS